MAQKILDPNKTMAVDAEDIRPIVSHSTAPFEFPLCNPPRVDQFHRLICSPHGRYESTADMAAELYYEKLSLICESGPTKT
jgi:hypothetical protein